MSGAVPCISRALQSRPPRLASPNLPRWAPGTQTRCGNPSSSPAGREGGRLGSTHSVAGGRDGTRSMTAREETPVPRYLPYVLATVGDIAGTAGPPGVQPCQPHQPGVQLVAHCGAEPAQVGRQHLQNNRTADGEVGAWAPGSGEGGAPEPGSPTRQLLTILPSPEPRSTVFPGRPRSSRSTFSTCRALAPT